MRSIVICIGGIPGTGKTTLSYQLATIFKIDKVINIDLLKSTLKALQIDTNPYLTTTSHEAYKIDNLDPISGYYRYCEVLNQYVVSVLKSLSNEQLVIVEGVTVNDQLIKQLRSENIPFIYLFICPFGMMSSTIALSSITPAIDIIQLEIVPIIHTSYTIFAEHMISPSRMKYMKTTPINKLISSVILFASEEVKFAIWLFPSGSIMPAISLSESINKISSNNGDTTVAISNNSPPAPTAFFMRFELARINPNPSEMYEPSIGT